MTVSFDAALQAEAQARLDALAKPPGSLGRLEGLCAWLAGCQGRLPPTVLRPRVLLFAADHGVARAQPVSPYPSEVTAAMVRTFLADRATVCLFARQAGAELEVVDVGVRGLPEGLPTEGPGPLLVRRPVGPGTRDLSAGPAMSEGEAEEASAAGREAAERAAAAGVDLLALGEMGIGNTTAAAAVGARLLGRPAVELVGPGTGLDAAGVARKAAVVQRALDRGGPSEAWGALADLGGFELCALAGCIERAAELRLPVLLDGFIVSVAALAACRRRPELAPFLRPATRSAEPGHAVVLEALALGNAILDLGLRLGEGSGAALALPILRAAAGLLHEVATLEEVLAGAGPA